MNQETRKNIAKNINSLRIKKGLKREELSLTLGFDNSYISKLEKGNVNITIDKVEMIADFFGVAPYILLK